MNQRQKKFVNEYLQSGNATDAAKRAGYSERSARQCAARLLTYDDVRSEIDNRNSILQRESVAGELELKEFLTSIVRGEITDVQPMTRLVGKGCSVIEKVEVRATIQNRIKAAEMLFRLYGAFNREEDTSSKLAREYMESLQKIWSEKDSA